MPECPRCKRQIDHLIRYQAHESKAEFTVTPDGKAHAVEVDSYPLDTMMDDWECPECGETLFEDQESAVFFLQGKTVQPIPEIDLTSLEEWLAIQANDSRNQLAAAI